MPFNNPYFEFYKKKKKKKYLVKVFHKILTAYNVVFFLIYNFFVLLISNVS